MGTSTNDFSMSFETCEGEGRGSPSGSPGLQKQSQTYRARALLVNRYGHESNVARLGNGVDHQALSLVDATHPIGALATAHVSDDLRHLWVMGLPIAMVVPCATYNHHPHHPHHPLFGPVVDTNQTTKHTPDPEISRSFFLFLSHTWSGTGCSFSLTHIRLTIVTPNHVLKIPGGGNPNPDAINPSMALNPLTTNTCKAMKIVEVERSNSHGCIVWGRRFPSFDL